MVTNLTRITVKSQKAAQFSDTIHVHMEFWTISSSIYYTSCNLEIILSFNCSIIRSRLHSWLSAITLTSSEIPYLMALLAAKDAIYRVLSFFKVIICLEG